MQTEYRGPRLFLAWHEVRAMGFSRALWRAGYELRKRLGLLRRPRPIDPRDPSAVLGEMISPPADAAELLEYFRRGGQGRFYFDPAARAEYVRAIERIGAAEATVAAADETCRGRFNLLCQQFDFAGGEIDWHLEPRAGASWPRVPWHRVDIRSDRRIGDVKFTWELNRHQYWPTLGRAYWLTGDEKYPERWVEQLDSWWAQNPPEVGVNWASNLEHALRVVSWLSAARLMLHSPAVTPPVLVRLIGTLICKARHIIADLDYSVINMANNHLIGDAMGLAVLGLALPELRESARWRNLGLGIMWREAHRQIYADGASFESSAGYHRFVLQFYLLTIALAEKNGAPVPDHVRRRVERMAEFLAVAVREDGSVPQFGDFDNGLAYRFSEHDVRDFRPVLSTAAVLFGRGDFKHAAGKLDAETVWLLGPDAAGAFEALDARPIAPGCRAFERGGCFFQRDPSRRVYLFVRNGPFTSHTHADLLSLCLRAGGRDLLIDAGTCTYNGDWRWRTHFRGTRSHNTVTLDSRGQALAHRTFRWLLAPHGRNHAFADGGQFVFDGVHDGYRRLGAAHRRILIGLDAVTWLCLDLVTGEGERRVEVRWHLSPELSAEAGEAGVVTGRAGCEVVLVLAAAASAEVHAAVSRGDEAAPAGWYSPHYGTRQPACEVVYAARARLPVCVATAISLNAPGAAPGVPVLEGDEIHVPVTCPRGSREVVYDLRAAQRAQLGHVANVGWIVGPHDGQTRTLAARRLARMDRP